MSDTVVEKKGDVTIFSPPEAGGVTPCDILRYSRELIKKYGWNDTFNQYANHKGGDPIPPERESNETDGYTLHDAIGAAGTRIWNNKDADGLRTEATDLLEKHMGGLDDKTWENQPGRTQQDVLDLFDTVIGAECK